MNEHNEHEDLISKYTVRIEETDKSPAIKYPAQQDLDAAYARAVLNALRDNPALRRELRVLLAKDESEGE